MISDITLGQFFPGSSAIHRLDPRTKIILSILFIVGVFLADTVVAFVFLTLAYQLPFSLVFLKKIGPFV